MRLRWILSSALLLLAVPLQGQERDTADAPVARQPADSAVAPPAVAPSADAAPADPADGVDAARAMPRLPASALRPADPDSGWVLLGYLRYVPVRRPLVSTLNAPRLPPPLFVDETDRWARRLDASLAEHADTLWRKSTEPAPPKKTLASVRGEEPQQPQPQARAQTPEPGDTVAFLPPPRVSTAARDTGTVSILGDDMSQYAQLGMQVSGRGEMGSSWEEYTPCNAARGFDTCEAGLVPQFRPDLQFGALVAGTVTDRIHVAVDYDQRREFEASNNINVYYQGLEDEILQRVEVGDVAIRLPQSSFLTTGVPGGNFGFKALAEVGPLQLQSVWAQQKGDIGSTELRLDGTRGGTLYDEQTITVDDYDYVSGRFFFLVDPSALPGYPHVDVLQLRAGDAPAQLTPTGGTLQVYRQDQTNPQQQTGAQYFFARAIEPEQPDTVSGWYRRLDPGDYVVHSSGLWIMLRQPLGETESLALAYVTAAGDTVGTLNAGQTGDDGEGADLRLLRGPTSSSHFPGAPTWEYEMHQVYSVYAGDVADEDISLAITLGDAAHGRTYVEWQDRQVPWIRLFGLDEAQPADRIDEDRLYRPARNSQSSTPINGTFLVFPTLRPFAEPPPVPSEGMASADALAALGADRVQRIYDERDPELRRSGRFRLRFEYRVSTDGLPSEFSLGAFGIRDQSETIRVDGQTLTRGRDYDIDYETGIVRLVDPQSVFAGRPNARITADYEQNPVFQIAPKTLFGTTARYGLGETGEINLVGLYQGEKAIMSRPQLGSEPSSIWMGGVNGNLFLDAGWMDRVLDGVPGLRLGGESTIALTGEIAMSVPNPNTRGVTWLDDFEASADLPISLNQRAWRLGSRPSTTMGDDGLMPVAPGASNAFELVWQDQFHTGGGVAGAIPADRVDRQIRTSGRSVPEPVLYMTLREDPSLPRDERVWRSMTSVIAPHGQDLTSTEFLEFYVSDDRSGDVALIIDLGGVGEDAFYIDSTGATGGVRDGEPWGLGVLDQEADFADGEIWSYTYDAQGLWNQDCLVEPGRIFTVGDPAAQCTVGNGVNDTEDLNNNGVPDLQDGPHFRYVVDLGGDAASPYLVRDTTETGSQFRLYRIPLRGARAMSINGADDNTWRSIRHMRVTVTSGRCSGSTGTGVDDGRPICSELLWLTRMRLIGSRWNKRSVHGVLEGLTDTMTVPGQQVATLEVGPVSEITDGSRMYEPPPGIRQEADDPSSTFGSTGVETNEKAMRVRYRELAPDARGEIYYRFPQEPRSLMQYHELRVWVLPRTGDWGPAGSQSLLIKLGTDDGNYYLHRTRLRPPTSQTPIVDTNWLPELVIDFEPWLSLKAEAERRVLLADTNGAEGLEIWNEDSTYAIVLQDRSQAPNLDGIRDLSFAIHNGSGVPADGELWINDMRLSGVRSETDFAGTLGVTAQLSDFANVRFTLANQGALFQQIGNDPTYQARDDLGVNARLELGRFAPAGWGLNAPLSVQHTRAAQDPLFLNSTDIEADRLVGLRESGNSRTQIGLALSKTTPSSNPWLGLVLDGSSLSLNYTTLDDRRFTSSTDDQAFSGRYGYRHALRRRELDITPDFVVGLLRAIMPARVEGSEFFERLSGADLRWSPTDVSLSASYHDRDRVTQNYAAVIESPRDSAFAPIESPARGLDQEARIGFQPLESLRAAFTTTSSRDLLPPEQASRRPLAQQAVADARGELMGLDLGWERNRSLGSSVQYTPFIASWLRPGVTVTTRYGTSRSPNNLTVDEDSADARMQRDFDVSRNVQRTLRLDPAGLMTSLTGAPADSAARAGQGWLLGSLRATVGAIQPVEASWSSDRESSFERRDFEAGYGYRFGFGGVDELRFLEGDTASLFRERDAFQVRTGIRLMKGTDLNLAYNDTEESSLNAQGGDNLQRETVWPDVQLSVQSLPLPGFAEAWLRNVSASTGFRRSETEQSFRGRVTRSVPVQFQATFPNGFSAGYTGSFARRRGVETTGGTRGDELSHDFTLRGRFDSPGFLGERFEQPLTATVRYGYRAQNQCRVVSREGGTSCAPYVDNLNRLIEMRLETTLSRIDVGMNFQFNDRASFVGTRDGNRQFQLGIYGQFSMGVGSLPSAAGQPMQGGGYVKP